VGEPEVWLWGSVRDLVDGSMGWRATIVNGITRTIFLNALHMSPDRMRRYVATLNATKPKLIIAYAESAFELATFAENQGIRVEPQEAMITSAGTLYPFMRSTIERVFQCRVFNRYGSREVGDIGFERPGCEGLWVAPWGSYIEIVDEAGRRLPPGREGEILVTSLTNYAMPLMRYRIGDRGALMPGESEPAAGRGQVLQSVIGRTCDTFRDRDGNLVHPGYFVFLLYFRDWVGKFQVIQKSLSCIVFKIVKSGPAPDRVELEEIARKTRFVMGEDCEVLFEFVDDIPVAESGKRRFTISDVAVAERQP
jgi:phenylacetate-CoA ligase